MAKITLLLKGGSRSSLLVSALFSPVLMLTGCTGLTETPGSAVISPLQSPVSSLPARPTLSLRRYFPPHRL